MWVNGVEILYKQQKNVRSGFSREKETFRKPGEGVHRALGPGLQPDTSTAPSPMGYASVGYTSIMGFTSMW